MGPGDPLFFDPDKDVPTPIDPKRIEDETVAALRKTGVAPQIIFAYKRTGRLLMRDNLANYPPEARAEWEAAIDEYFRLEEQASGDAPKEEGRPGADMRTSPTQILELRSRPLTPEEYEAITRCLQAIDEILSDAVTLALRVELAAVMTARDLVRSSDSSKTAETEGGRRRRSCATNAQGDQARDDTRNVGRGRGDRINFTLNSRGPCDDGQGRTISISAVGGRR